MSGAHTAPVGEEPHGKRLGLLAIAALGVVYGDIGTSPLYAVRECFYGDYAIKTSPENVLGVLSLMFWALAIIVSTKYLGFILRADNGGEGGVIALSALSRRAKLRKTTRWVLAGLGLFGAALLYGDGMITPSISVLSAIEGVRLIAPALSPYVLHITVAILIGLFVLQRHGSQRVGSLFGPVTLIWLVTIAALGIHGIAGEPRILRAVNPWYGFELLSTGGAAGFLVLGAVFLVATGAEALYADLGHFGRKAIRLPWFGLVLPALLCSYFGQGAAILANPAAARHPFYALAPGWLGTPLVVLATMATIIASQAVISGAFSLTRQLIALGYLPRLRVVHTSPESPGQIYIPQVNWALMVSTVILVLGFQTSSRLAAAYGVAVTATMVITTTLFYVVVRRRWDWPLWKALPPIALFLVVNLSFFAANSSKLMHGAWFPLAIGAGVFTMLITWKKGRKVLAKQLFDKAPTLLSFVGGVAGDPPRRVPGNAVFMAGKAGIVPPALTHNLKHNHVLHEQVAVLTIETDENTPFVARDQRVAVTDLGQGIYRVLATYGFSEAPNVREVMALAHEHGLPFEIDGVTFFLGQERVQPARHPAMSLWREKLFAFMQLNSTSATSFYEVPADQVVELGVRVEL